MRPLCWGNQKYERRWERDDREDTREDRQPKKWWVEIRRKAKKTARTVPRPQMEAVV